MRPYHSFHDAHPILKHVKPEEVQGLKLLCSVFYGMDAEGKALKGPQFATGKILHFWGQFTSELPEKFQPDGPNGHQYIKCKTLEEAEELCQELREFIFEKWPDSVEWASDGWYRWMIHDMRQMTFEFRKKK